MFDRRIIASTAFGAVVVFLLMYDGCGKTSVVDRYVDRIKTDTLWSSDTVVIKKRYRDTVTISTVDSIPVVYWDTVYEDSVRWYVVNYSDSNITVDNEILAGGKIYETKFWFNYSFPEKIITNTVTVTNTETTMSYRKGLYFGFGAGYPLSINAAIGWQFKNGSIILGQKDFLSKETFNVCLVTPVFRR
jgi:hypothetical protein